jgi:hypothetical protein
LPGRERLFFKLPGAAFAAALALLAPCGPAAGKTAGLGTLSVQGATAGSARPMRIFWMNRLDEEAKNALLGPDRRPVALPGRFYVGTRLPGGSNSFHMWKFENASLSRAVGRNGLRLAVKEDLTDCFPPRVIEEMGRRYNAGMDIPDLLSGVIQLGHEREICRARGTVQGNQGATEANKQVQILYRILAQRMPGSFTGRMCQVTRIEVIC